MPNGWRVRKEIEEQKWKRIRYERHDSGKHRCPELLLRACVHALPPTNLVDKALEEGKLHSSRSIERGAFFKASGR